MKSEEFILQELEKDRLEKIAQEEGRPGLAENEKPNIKFMISGEAPVFMSKACELLIKDLTHRAWSHTERNRRRTLQRQDLHAAVGESEVYDFLIDIVPRVSAPAQKVHTPPPPPPGIPAGVAGMGGASHLGMVATGIPHGMQMQAPAAVHAGIPAAAAMPPGAMGTVQEDPNAVLQHMDQQQHVAQATQQPQYHHDPTQHAAAASIHAQHHAPPQQQQVPPQHHQAYPRGLQQQDEASPTPQTGQSGEQAPSQEGLWHQDTTAND